jgi:hypothetical protein
MAPRKSIYRDDPGAPGLESRLRSTAWMSVELARDVRVRYDELLAGCDSYYRDLESVTFDRVNRLSSR